MDEESKPGADDERPPICPACGVTMGIIVEDDGTTRYVYLGPIGWTLRREPRGP